MMRGSDTRDFERYLAAHAPADPKRLLSDGSVADGWRVTAFLGKGGNGEVYRVERVAEDAPTAGARTPVAPCAALKILARDNDTARNRFAREIELLSQNRHSAFPRYFGSGEIRPSSGDGRRPYYVMELLEPVELPQGDRAVAVYLLAVVRAIEALHRAGLVHRDIKPQNVMRRANGELVLIDLGLVRPVSGLSGASGLTVTVEDGRAVGVGTPRYAAPEQFNGGAVSPATDIHALGMLLNECFGGRPPRAWERIISRSTSSIPERRYADIGAFARAIRRRHGGRNLFRIGAAAMAVTGAVVLIRAWVPAAPPGPPWRAIATDVRTNIVARQVVREKYATNDFGVVMMTERSWRNVTNAVAGTVLRLNRQMHKFEDPILLETNRCYWVVGPGTLDAPIEGYPGSRLYLDNCALVNRTKKPLRECGVRYIFRKGAYLNFINQGQNDDYRAYIEDFDGAYNALEFQGPESVVGDFRR